MVSQSIKIAANTAILAQLEASLNPRQLKSAIYSATKKTTDQTRTQVRKEVSDRTYMRPKYINRVVTSYVRGTPPIGTITVVKELVPLVGFKVSVTKRGGVVAQISKTLPPVIIRHGFKAFVRSAIQSKQGADVGHTGIFYRSRHLPTKGNNFNKGKLTPRGIAGRLAIEEAFGPSVYSIIDVPEVLKSIETKADAVMRKNLLSQLDRFLK